MTHANDFYDYLEFLNIDNYDKVFADVYYNAFFNWTEFHARQLGYKRYVEYTFIKSWKLFKKSKKNLLENICLNFNNHTENGIKYDLMQAMGRYYSFCSLSGSAMKMNFKEDILKGNVDATVLDEYEEIYEQIMAKKQCLSIKELAVTGTDLIADGMQPGKAIGETLKQLLEYVLEHPEDNTKEKLMEQVHNIASPHI